MQRKRWLGAGDNPNLSSGAPQGVASKISVLRQTWLGIKIPCALLLYPLVFQILYQNCWHKRSGRRALGTPRGRRGAGPLHQKQAWYPNSSSDSWSTELGAERGIPGPTSLPQHSLIPALHSAAGWSPSRGMQAGRVSPLLSHSKG